MQAMRQALRTVPVTIGGLDTRERTASIVVVVPGRDDLVPDRRTDVTPQGRARATKKRSQSDSNELFLEVICSLSLAAALTALASGPALEEAVVLALTTEKAGDGRPIPVAFCSIARSNAARVDDDAVASFFDYDGVVEQRGRTGAIEPLEWSEYAASFRPCSNSNRAGNQLDHPAAREAP